MGRIVIFLKRLLLPAMLICSMLASMTAYAAPVLDEETKREYYEEYKEIVNDISLESGKKIGVLPMSEFKEEDWRSPAEFRKFVNDLAYSKFTETPETQAVRSAGSATKNVGITVDGISSTIAITGKFNTQYNSSTGRQHFSGVSSVTSKAVGSGTWTQIGYDAEFIDSSRTCYLIVSGNITISGVYTTKYVSAYFYCDANGGIS